MSWDELLKNVNPTWKRLGLHEKVFFHGTHKINALNLINSQQFEGEPDEELDRNLKFGFGGYVTPSFADASQYANRRANKSGVVLGLRLAPQHPSFYGGNRNSIYTAIPTTGFKNQGKTDVWVAQNLKFDYGPDRLSRYNPKIHNPPFTDSELVVRPKSRIAHFFAVYQPISGGNTPSDLSSRSISIEDLEKDVSSMYSRSAEARRQMMEKYGRG